MTRGILLRRRESERAAGTNTFSENSPVCGVRIFLRRAVLCDTRRKDSARGQVEQRRRILTKRGYGGKKERSLKLELFVQVESLICFSSLALTPRNDAPSPRHIVQFRPLSVKFTSPTGNWPGEPKSRNGLFWAPARTRASVNGATEY